MNAVPFDTLRMAHRLESAGFSVPQAAGAAEALAEVIVSAELATKGDVLVLKADVLATGADLRNEITAVRTDLRHEITAVRTELLAAIELLRRDKTIRLGGMLIAAVGVLLTAMRFMPHP